MSTVCRHQIEGTAPTPPGQTVIRAGWIIDGQGGAPQFDQLIVFENGRIVAIAPGSPEMPLPAGVMDFSHATILPALMDAHVHLALSGTVDADYRKNQIEATPQQTKKLMAQHMADHLKCGIAAVRDGGDKNGRVIACRDQKALPHVAATCWAWHSAGRYGGMIGRPLDSRMIRSNAFSTHLKGADHIKLILSGLNSIDHFGRQTPPQFTADQLAAIANVANQQKLPMMVHANGEAPVAMAVDAGCRSIEHGYFMGRDNLMRLADSRIFWAPTAIPMAALIDLEAITPVQADVARKTLDHQLEQINFAHRQGVPIALGTDAGAIGVHHGTAVAREIALMLKAGLPISQAVRCASLNSARLMGLKSRGALSKGWCADLIAVPGLPEDLPESLSSIEAIWINGEKMSAGVSHFPAIWSDLSTPPAGR